MPKTAAAEWFLRLFTTPDRAASIAGDMSEEGRVSWFDTLRTAAALFFRNLAAAPLRIALLVLLGLLLSSPLVSIAIMPKRHFWTYEIWQFRAYYIAANQIMFPTLIGWALVRLGKGRDITACLAYVAVHVVIVLAAQIHILHNSLLVRPPVMLPHSWLGAATTQAISAFFLLASGALARRRSLNRQLTGS
jgi:hypothetical protein